MEKVELLLHLRGNMHHYPGILIFGNGFWKHGFCLWLLLFYLVSVPIYFLLNCTPTVLI